MQMRGFAIPMDGDATEERNRLLRGQEVISVEKVAVLDQGWHYWSICAEHLPRRIGEANPSARSGKTALDSDLLTNVQIADMARAVLQTKSELGAISASESPNSGVARGAHKTGRCSHSVPRHCMPKAAGGHCTTVASSPAMNSPTPGPSPSHCERVRELFERARSLPIAEREAFVRANAADISMADELLALLRLDHEDATKVLHDRLRGTGAPGDKVQSTATADLLKKLTTAPKLDTNRYVMEGELGQGGMGVVMRIHDQHLNRHLAMKVLIERGEPRDDEERRLVHQLLGRFLEEAQVTSQLDHPGVVPVHELGLDQSGKVYFTMRMVKGRTASEVFADAYADTDDWTVTRGLEVILWVCDTMSYAHDKGVLHRDLKPANVMVGRFGEVYVMDWGLAKVLGQADRQDLRIRKDSSTGVSRLDTARQRDVDTDATSSVVSMDGQQLGTPSYMAPEQARSEDLDVRADVYSIGAMMYELLTGRAPYTAPGVRQPAYRILNDVVDGPPKRIEDVRKGVAAELVAIVARAMSRDRGQRYANTVELAADIRAYLAQRTVKAYRTGALVEMRLWVRRNKALASALAAAVWILVAGIFFTSVYAQRADQQAKEKAQLATQESAARKQFEGKVKEFDQLSLVVAYEQLMAEEVTLVPGWPHQVAAIDAWVQRARQLLAQRDAIAATVAAMRQRATAATEADAAAAAAAGFLAKSLLLNCAKPLESPPPIRRFPRYA